MKHYTLPILAFMMSFSSVSQAEVPVYQDESRPIEERVEDALKRMTLREKVAMCHAEGKFASAGVRIPRPSNIFHL